MIQNVRQVRRKIRTVNNIKKITRAMEMVSAAKLRKVQDRLFSIRPYADKMKILLGHLSSVVKDLDYPLFKPGKEGAPQLLIAISSDKGLCGSFNANLIRHAQRFVSENPNTEVITIGKKISDYAQKQSLISRGRHVGVPIDISYADIMEITGPIVEDFEQGRLSKVTVLHTEFINTMVVRPRTFTFLPVQQESGEGDKMAFDYIYEPTPAEILGKLVPRYVGVAFYRTLLESMASEYAARMTSMKNATDNAEELIGTLTLIYNKTRQATITRELLDIVSGAEALK